MTACARTVCASGALGGGEELGRRRASRTQTCQRLAPGSPRFSDILHSEVPRSGRGPHPFWIFHPFLDIFLNVTSSLRHFFFFSLLHF